MTHTDPPRAAWAILVTPEGSKPFYFAWKGRTATYDTRLQAVAMLKGALGITGGEKAEVVRVRVETRVVGAGEEA